MAAPDRFRPAEDDAPAQDAFVITPDNAQNEQQDFRAIYVGVSGDVSVYTLRERSVVFKNVPAGSVLPVSGKRVNSTNTSAQFLVGLI